MAVEFETDVWSWASEQETSYGVMPAAPTWDVIDGTLPSFTLGRDIQELNRAVSSAFTDRPKQAGSKHGGTFTFTAFARSQLTTYDDPTDSLAIAPELFQLALLMGAIHAGTSVAADVAAASAANSWNLTTGTPDEGACYLVGVNGDTGLDSLGWVTDLATGTPNVATLFEDGIVVPTTGNDLYGMATLAPSNDQPNSYTWYLKGVSTEHALFLHGCVITGATIRIMNGRIAEIDYTMIFDGWTYDAAAGEGVETTTDVYREFGRSKGTGGRLTIDGESTGTGDTEGTCGIGEVTVELSAEVYNQPCHGGPQGYSGVRLRRNPARISFFVPWTDDWITGDDSDWDLSLENGTSFSLMMQGGTRVGDTWSIFVPEAMIVEQPALVENESVVGWNLVASPKDTYSGDTGSTFPANTPIRIAFG